jgi:hypothetical protein
VQGIHKDKPLWRDVFEKSLHIAEVDTLNWFIRKNSFIRIRQDLADFPVLLYFADDPHLEIPFHTFPLDSRHEALSALKSLKS